MLQFVFIDVLGCWPRRSPWLERIWSGIENWWSTL